MEGALTISKRLPVRKSMQYEELRQLGIQHIQTLAGKLWTDYNTHDPGITMLEILSYAITELGYRVNNEMMDILAQDPNDPNIKDIQNFYTACEILPNCALTFNDYRKLMMDVELIEEDTVVINQETITQTTYSGVKNAWINCVKNDAEKEIFVDRKNSELSLAPVPNVIEQESYFVKTLYDVLLEFDKNDKYGDLNENKLVEVFEPNLTELNNESDLLGIRFLISIEFPRWDEPDLDWNDVNAIIAKIKPGNLKISIIGNVNIFPWQINVNDPAAISIDTDGGPNLNALAAAFNNRVLFLGTLYKDKVKKIEEIICAVKARLHANRNLCDDFFRFHALKIEEIILCSDIELTAEADVEKVAAAILLAIADFLAPKVYFYTLEEMRNKCRNAKRYNIASVNKNKRIFTINDQLTEDINKDDVISVEGIPAAGVYTVKCIAPNAELAGHIDIQVLEEIITENIESTAVLFKGVIEEDTCLTVDQIFEGPKLKHGFIDEHELEKADRQKYIHVSDLIRIIMDVEGVHAVKNIQIANNPLDNDTNIPSRSVKWCMALAVQENYVPRLNMEDSILTFYKGQLPFIGKKEEVDKRLDELEKNQRPQKIRYPKLDIPVPSGEFKDLESYTSVQEHFPLFYGLGYEGIPGLGSMNQDQRKLKESSVKQHKAYLLFLDQFLANFMSQLSHVKELFSMNGDKNKFGEYEISKSYFAQPLNDVIPNADDLYINDKSAHELILQEMVESSDVFEPRRNKFLDHLLGRFAETFSDYALLTYKVSGAKAPHELIEDKLQFLKKYPILSASRGKGMNYKAPCNVWHVNNVSGLELRASLLLGIEEKNAVDLIFSSNFSIQENNGLFSFEIKDENGLSLLQNYQVFDAEEEAKIMLESIIVNGTCIDNYKVISDNQGNFEIQLECENEVLAKSVQTYTDLVILHSDIDEMVKTLSEEFHNNTESNRKNLACPIDKYFKTFNVQANAATFTDPASISFQYDLYQDSAATKLLFSGSFERQSVENPTEEEKAAFVHKHLWEILTLACERNQYVFKTEEENGFDYYRFHLCDRFANDVTIGKSEEADVNIEPNFNNKLKYELENLNNIPAFGWQEWVTVSAPNITGISHLSNFASVGVDEAIVELTLNDPLPNELLNLPFSEVQISFRNAFEIVVVNAQDRFFEINVDSNELNKFLLPQDQINILQPDLESILATYTILSLESAGTATRVFVKEPIPDLSAPDTVDPSLGYSVFLASYSKKYEVKSINGNIISFYGKEDEKALDRFIDWLKLKFFSQEGMHLIEHHLLRPRSSDSLLPIHLDQDCENCKITDPYSCVASVILPYWPGRFQNMDVRKFIEKTLRTEAPAHAFLNICWVNCEDMHAFESAYRKWLLAISKKTPDLLEQSQCLTALIEALTATRNVYPKGTLHSCDDEDTFQGSVILNHSSLGIF